MSADDKASLTFDDSTTIESLFDVVFGAIAGISIESPPPPFSIMSTAIKNYSAGVVLPIESFCCSNSTDTDPEIYTSGYEYFVEELIAASESSERRVAGNELYDYFGPHEIKPPITSQANPIRSKTVTAKGLCSRVWLVIHKINYAKPGPWRCPLKNIGNVDITLFEKSHT